VSSWTRDGTPFDPFRSAYGVATKDIKALGTMLGRNQPLGGGLPHAARMSQGRQSSQTARISSWQSHAWLSKIAKDHVAPVVDILDRPLARPRFNAFLLGVFGAVALLLAAVGLYAVIAAHVRQRGQEIAVRLALGATASGVRRLVLTEAVRLAGLGAVIGLAGAMASTRLLRGMLFEVDPLDPFAIAGAALLLVGVSALASYLPARRATRIDATAMLRSQ